MNLSQRARWRCETLERASVGARAKNAWRPGITVIVLHMPQASLKLQKAAFILFKYFISACLRSVVLWQKITAIWHDPVLAHPFLQFNGQTTFLMPSGKKEKKEKIIELLWRSDCSYAANVIFAVCVLPAQ